MHEHISRHLHLDDAYDHNSIQVEHMKWLMLTTSIRNMASTPQTKWPFFRTNGFKRETLNVHLVVIELIKVISRIFIL